MNKLSTGSYALRIFSSLIISSILWKSLIEIPLIGYFFVIAYFFIFVLAIDIILGWIKDITSDH